MFFWNNGQGLNISDWVLVGNTSYMCLVWIVGYFGYFRRGFHEILDDCTVILHDWSIYEEQQQNKTPIMPDIRADLETREKRTYISNVTVSYL